MVQHLSYCGEPRFTGNNKLQELRFDLSASLARSRYEHVKEQFRGEHDMHIYALLVDAGLGARARKCSSWMKQGVHLT